tara:strand:- start:100 stop:234 length:135 start_codon:yes stop_codon:yes gene_type:complete
MWTHFPYSGIFWSLFVKGLGGGMKIELQININPLIMPSAFNKDF